MIKRFCTENYTSIPLVIARGADRIELCDNLAVSGIALSTGVIEETLGYAREKDIPMMTIIRPRGDDFVYNDIKLKIMHTDLIEAKKLGTGDVVFGYLTPSGWLDEEASELLIETAKGLQIIFHMAFDSIPKDRQFEVIDWLIERDVGRILIHGGPANKTIVENFPRLKELVVYTDGCSVILPGGSVTAENAIHVAKELNVGEVYGTKIVDLQL